MVVEESFKGNVICAAVTCVRPNVGLLSAEVRYAIPVQECNHLASKYLNKIFR